MDTKQVWNPAGFMQSVPDSGAIIPVTNAETTPLVQGTPVYITSAGKVRRASIDNDNADRVVGLVLSEAIAPGASGQVQAEELFVLADWTAITGQPTLVPNELYYLGAKGTLVPTPPIKSGNHLVRVGLAISLIGLMVAIDYQGKV